MNKVIKRSSKKRRGVVRVFIRLLSAFSLFLYDRIRDDLILILYNGRLFFGIALILIGVLSFDSGKYCDGNTSSYYACTRPSTYYYYSWWAITLAIVGLFLIVLWFLHRKKH